MVSVRMVIVPVVVGHGVADRGASDATHDRPDSGAADPARDRARFVGKGDRGRGAERGRGRKRKKKSS
jgi:hypothetical protein